MTTVATSTPAEANANTPVAEVALETAADPNAATASIEASPSPSPTPEQIAAQEAENKIQQERQERRQRLREVAQNKAAAFRLRRDRDAAKEQAQRAELARQADLARVQTAEQWEKLKGDPEKALEFLESQGLTTQQLTEAALKRGTPEQLYQRAVAEAEAAAKAAAKRELDEYKAQMQRERMEAEDRRANLDFIKMVNETVVDGAPKWPALSALYTPAQLVAEANHIANRALQAGRVFKFEDIADFLEEQAQPRYTKVRGTAKPVSPHPTGSTAASSQPAATSSPAARAPALTNGAGTPSALPEGFEKLSKKQQNEFWASEYHRLAKK